MKNFFLFTLSVLMLCSCNSSQNTVQTTKAYLETLSQKQLKEGHIKFNSKERYNWHFFPLKTRKGFMIKHMNPNQRKKALRIVESLLSRLGYERAMTIMELESVLRALENNPSLRDSEKYYLTVFGTPGDKRWGISYEGHHLSLNFVLENNEILSSTPFFFGVNPAVVIDNGGVDIKEGTRLLADQEDKAFKFFKSLTMEQKSKALVSKKNPPAIKGYNKLPGPRKKIGLAVSNLNSSQKKLLMSLLKTFTENAEEGFAAESNYEFEQELNQMYFAWYGNTTSFKKPHAFRIEGPETYMIFHNFQKDSLGNPANHVHSLWRNRLKDFGLNLENP